MRTAILVIIGTATGLAGGFLLAGRLSQPGYDQLHWILKTQTTVELGRYLNNLALLDAQEVALVRERLLTQVATIVHNLVAQPEGSLDSEAQRQLRIAKAYFTVHPTEDPALEQALEKVSRLPGEGEVRDCSPQLQALVEQARAEQ